MTAQAFANVLIAAPTGNDPLLAAQLCHNIPFLINAGSNAADYKHEASLRGAQGSTMIRRRRQRGSRALATVRTFNAL